MKLPKTLFSIGLLITAISSRSASGQARLPAVAANPEPTIPDKTFNRAGFGAVGDAHD